MTFQHCGRGRISRNSGLLTVTLTHAAQGKCNYGKAGQEWTDGHDADEHLSTPNIGHLRSWGHRTKAGMWGDVRGAADPVVTELSLSPMAVLVSYG